MIITLNSQITRLKTSSGKMTGSQGDPSFILHGNSRHYYWEGTGLLSIKTFFSGQALYYTGRGYYAVNDESYLLLNHGQLYSIAIDSPTTVESFCIFFGYEFVEEVYRSLITPTERLIDMPETAGEPPIHFFERTYPHDDLLSPFLFYLRDVLVSRKQEQGWLMEQFHELLKRLLSVHINVYKQVEALPAVRSTTREELYRRLYLAKDYAYALFDTPITLEDMAHVACLSPNHFLRMFKQVFHQTPYQYIINRRLEYAQKLLLQTDRSITDICFAVGFESLGSFSWLFRRRIGISPTSYRLQKR